ncbi:hypothetical protein Asp14428_73900 [Actinoplanes sp. NBRC 14428]|nr:hypothetical protein Asp14428_73900 [Actinoplanes sp. NBRC 14428]
MTAVVHDTAHPTAEPIELLRTMLEEQLAVHTARLTADNIAPDVRRPLQGSV